MEKENIRKKKKGDDFDAAKWNSKKQRLYSAKPGGLSKSLL